MADTAGQITEERLEYHEVKEASLFETVLRDRGVRLPVVIAVVCSVFAIALALFHLYIAVYGTPERRSFRGTHLTVMLVLAVLLNPLFRGSYRDALLRPGARGNALRVSGFLIDLVLVGFGLFVQGWTLWDIDGFNMRDGDITQLDLWVGLGFIVLVLEATRRAVGWAMVLVTGFFVLHSLYSPYFFGFLYGPPTSLRKYIDVIFMSADGIFGIPLMVVATYILLFIIFGALLIRSGAGRFFIDLAVSLTGHRIGGPAKAAVVASGFMGTVSGSAVANVVTTGSFTIPLMKQLGYRARFAAAVEACASSGGQITPPIMGAAAFIIAEFLRVNLLVVIVAAIIPAFLYFATVYFMVHLEAEKHGIVRIPKEKLPHSIEVLKRGWHLLISLVVLIALLGSATRDDVGVLGHRHPRRAELHQPRNAHEPGRPARGARERRAQHRAGDHRLRLRRPHHRLGVRLGARPEVHPVGDRPVGRLPADAARADRVRLDPARHGDDDHRGLHHGRGADRAVARAHGGAADRRAHVRLLLRRGLDHHAAGGAGLVRRRGDRGQPADGTAVESAQVGIAKYLVPFIFVYNPSLLFEGPLWLTGFSLVTALGGVWALSAAIEGWLRGRLNVLLRGVMIGSALLLLYPPQLSLFGLSGYAATIVGAAMAATLFFVRSRGREAVAPAGGVTP